MNQPVQIIVVGVPEAALDIASNKRVKVRPPSYGPSTRRDPWPLNHQPIPDSETRRALDDARREIANSRPEITRHLNAARREIANSRGEIQRFLRASF